MKKKSEKKSIGNKTSSFVSFNIYTRLSPKGLGIAFGVMFALYLFLLGLAAAWLNWGVSLVNMISAVYIGYGPSVVGSIIGAIWGFIDGFICGLVLALLYNLFVK